MVRSELCFHLEKPLYASLHLSTDKTFRVYIWNFEYVYNSLKIFLHLWNPKEEHAVKPNLWVSPTVKPQFCSCSNIVFRRSWHIRSNLRSLSRASSEGRRWLHSTTHRLKSRRKSPSDDSTMSLSRTKMKKRRGMHCSRLKNVKVQITGIRRFNRL